MCVAEAVQEQDGEGHLISVALGHGLPRLGAHQRGCLLHNGVACRYATLQQRKSGESLHAHADAKPGQVRRVVAPGMIP